MSITKGEIDKKKLFLHNLKNNESTELATWNSTDGRLEATLCIDIETKEFLIERLSKQLKHDVEQYTSDLKEEVNKLIE